MYHGTTGTLLLGFAAVFGSYSFVGAKGFDVVGLAQELRIQYNSNPFYLLLSLLVFSLV